MKPEDTQRYVLIGLGGIGGLLMRLLVPFLHHECQQQPGAARRVSVVAADGDSYETVNRSRTWFGRLGPKAEVLTEELAGPYGDRLTLLPVPHYVTPQRARWLIQTGDVVFCQPDNHATRRVVERRCARLENLALFSGGNDGVENGSAGTFGNVQVFLRARGRNVTNPLSTFHPEIAAPADRLPTEQGCAAATPSAPQLLFTNAAVATAMLGAFYAWRRGALAYEEAYLDVLTGKHVPVSRKLRASAESRPE